MGFHSVLSYNFVKDFSKPSFTIQTSALSSTNVTIRGDMFQFKTLNGLYLSSSNLSMPSTAFDFYSNVKSISGKYSPVNAFPVYEYDVVDSGKILQFKLSENLLVGNYDILYFNGAGYYKASQTSRFTYFTVVSGISTKPSPSVTPTPTITPTPTPTLTPTPLPYHVILESESSISPADGSRGESRFLYENNYDAPQYVGFKIGPACRIKNCTITLINTPYVSGFGVDTNWDLIGYFSTSDINITSDGIGRQGFGDLGGGWISDICGFYLKIPTQYVQNAKEFVIDYQYVLVNDPSNKHGIGFLNDVSTSGGGGLDNDWIGTWDNATYARLPTDLSRITITPQAATGYGLQNYNRRIIVKSV